MNPDLGLNLGPHRRVNSMYSVERSYARYGGKTYEFERIVSVTDSTGADAWMVTTVSAYSPIRARVHHWISETPVQWEQHGDGGPGWYER